MKQNLSSSTPSRKNDHLRICIENDVSYDNISTGFENFSVLPSVFTDLSPQDVSLTTSLLDKPISAPIMIAGMTGGSEKGKEINKTIAKICAEFNIGMGVGSQRAAIEDPHLADSYQVREIAEKIPLLANLGIAQFSSGYTVTEAEDAVEMIHADGIAIHINPLQEFIQFDGDKKIINMKQNLSDLVNKCKYPVIAKGVGTGFSKNDILFLSSLDIQALDIAGAGGTNWKKIEKIRTPLLSNLSSQLINWGIPTATCLEHAVEVFSESSKKIIASGGIWNGMDAVKALILGADCVAFALPVLLAINKDAESGLRKFLYNYILEMKIVLSMLGMTNLQELKQKKNVLMRKPPH